MTFKYMLFTNPPEYDHDNIRFVGGGSGFIGRTNGKKYLDRCPSCKTENYAAAMPSGTCAWCGCAPFDDAEEVSS